MVSDSWFDIHLANLHTVYVVETYQLLAALGPFKILLRFHVIDADIPTILGMRFLVTVNL